MLSAMRMYSDKEKREVWLLLGLQRVSGLQIYEKLQVALTVQAGRIGQRSGRMSC